MNPVVTLARHEDEDQILSLLRLRHEESGLGTFDASKARYVVRLGIERQFANIGVIRESAEVVGSIGLYIGSDWDTSDLFLQDRWNFVHPDHRRTTYAKNLIEFAKDVAVRLKRPLVMSILSNERTLPKEKLLERQLPRAGSIFVFHTTVAIPIKPEIAPTAETV